MTLNSKCAVSNVPIRKYFINKQSKQTSSNWICDQADAFARGVDPLLTVSISGDMAKAKNLASADEGQEEDFRTRMFKAHPLSVTLSIRTGKSEVGLLDEGIKNFTYWPRRGPILSHEKILRPSPNADTGEASESDDDTVEFSVQSTPEHRWLIVVPIIFRSTGRPQNPSKFCFSSAKVLRESRGSFAEEFR